MKVDEQLFERIVDDIQKTTDCGLCSLWRINSNTHDTFQSVSLIAQKLKECFSYIFIQNEDYVHDLGDCFIQQILFKTQSDQKPYYFCGIEECKTHRSIEAIKSLNLKFFIGIPIYDHKQNKTIAVLKLSYLENPRLDQVEQFSIAVSDVINSCINRYTLFKKRQVIEDLMKIYQEKGNRNNIRNFFNNIVKEILPKYFNYEGASFFMWDSFLNHYQLLSSTGIKDITTAEYNLMSYVAGVGLTGKVAKEKKTRIYSNLDDEEINNRDYKNFCIENTKHKGKTMMVVPIFRLSKTNEVIGILRFINKMNKINNEVVDYFNDTDDEIMTYAAKYLALTIDYFLREEERNDFISKLSHEFKNPSQSIFVTADRIVKQYNNPQFIERDLLSYIKNIRDFSELQMQQAETNLYVSKMHLNKPLSQRYTISKNSLRRILTKARHLVIPFARIENATFDNIEIDQYFPNWELYIDKIAFETIFHNLLTNAIKYRDPNSTFSVKIEGYGKPEWVIINVSDYGVGIDSWDKDKIFFLGYRGDNVTRYNSNGFGIGLAVVKQIVEDFNGEIYVTNLKNPTIFEIKLPRHLFYNSYTKEEIWNQAQ